MARRDDREYWAYLSEEQRRQPGCPARELGDELRFQGTRSASKNARPRESSHRELHRGGRDIARRPRAECKDQVYWVSVAGWTGLVPRATSGTRVGRSLENGRTGHTRKASVAGWTG